MSRVRPGPAGTSGGGEGGAAVACGEWLWAGLLKRTKVGFGRERREMSTVCITMLRGFVGARQCTGTKGQDRNHRSDKNAKNRNFETPPWAAAKMELLLLLLLLLFALIAASLLSSLPKRHYCSD